MIRPVLKSGVERSVGYVQLDTDRCVATWAALKFDEFPFGLLTMVVSLEAIFVAPFVMVGQNRQAARSDGYRTETAATTTKGWSEIKRKVLLSERVRLPGTAS